MNTYNFQFLGTCACDYSPKLKTEFKDCFNKDARRASSLLMNDHFLIDCGPHCIDAMRIAGVNMKNITDLFITHLHSDHFNPQNIETIALSADRKLNLWVSEDADLPEIKNINVVRMKKLEKYQVTEDLSITGLYANHDPNTAPQHLLFERNEKKFLYATDGAWILNLTFEHIRKSHLALFIVDATCGNYEGDYRVAEHNSIPMIRLMMPSLRTAEIIDDNTVTYLTHIAPSLHKSHDETVEIVKNDGLHVAYDGLKFAL